ncbi:MAG TPA: 50S ribosomal protein L5 [Methermicoccus shengliensis]|uniref:Large ribosomal subunit protein uL5 n=2 Tax=Methermicoccus shengliensis TaxID=660064 RepID=A0A832RSJ5_9EURY|nr:MAG: 50S ribosomal protein L5 [Euryarchaeota archaeon 55_53]MDI3488421.1 large subunit ribosomal protein [Methanosarcinales archaeon]MDN5294660.1 large subunit ribosomal protein [Methanosarcinales archaeon]HIH69370.1 50S ribosomal protein L5 [Methermicoccus shengliensis]
MAENPMRALVVDKVVVHMCVGESGQALVNGESILEQISGQKPVRSKAKKTLPSFGIKKREPIAARVTLRGKRAVDFLTHALDIVDRQIPGASFDENGNFSFGIEEHTDFPGMAYDPNIGIYGMDVTVCIARRGYRVARRRRQRARLGAHHRVTREEAMQFMRDAFGVEVV